MKEFTFKTKFDLGETLYYYDSFTKKLEEFHVERINFFVKADGIDITYSNGTFNIKSENELFRSKQEFVDSL